MERVNGAFELSKEFLDSGYLKPEDYRDIISKGIAQEIVLKIHDKLEIEEEYLKEEHFVKYSTEFLMMKPEELKDISEILRRIYALANNRFIHENVKEIAKLLGLK